MAPQGFSHRTTGSGDRLPNPQKKNTAHQRVMPLCIPHRREERSQTRIPFPAEEPYRTQEDGYREMLPDVRTAAILPQVAADDLQELLPRILILQERPGKRRSSRHGVLLLNAAHLHAGVRRLDE